MKAPIGVDAGAAPDGGTPLASVEQPPFPVQRPDQRSVQLPAASAAQEPSAKTGELVYVPGWQYILSGHRENFFISGVTRAQNVVKFQYSAKFNLWPNSTAFSAYFAFTQTSLWRLWDFDHSSPLDESNYAPELFLAYYRPLSVVTPAMTGWNAFVHSAAFGFEHESNGLDKDSSRGWNRVQGWARSVAYLGPSTWIAVSPRAWWSFDKGDNPNIARYLGYGSLTMELGLEHGWGGFAVASTLRPGWDKGPRWGSLESSARWTPRFGAAWLRWVKFTPSLYVQHFRGYGETLLQYDHDVSSLRVGFVFSDRVPWVIGKR